jgi:predicted transcriptional regulator
LDEDLLEDVDARLDDVREVVSRDRREMVEGALETGVAGGS